MADSTTALATKYPPFASKAELIRVVWEECGPNSPGIRDVLFRLAHTDLQGTGSVSDGATVTPASYHL